MLLMMARELFEVQRLGIILVDLFSSNLLSEFSALIPATLFPSFATRTLHLDAGEPAEQLL